MRLVLKKIRGVRVALVVRDLNADSFVLRLDKPEPPCADRPKSDAADLNGGRLDGAAALGADHDSPSISRRTSSSNSSSVTP